MSEINNILFATDFSERTENVLIYTLNIAAKLSSKIICYNAFAKSQSEEQNSISEKEASAKMQKMINSVAGINTHINFDSVILRGDFTEHIESLVKEKSIGLVVIGAKNVGWRSPFITGRKTGKIIKLSPCPVLIIPEHFIFKPLHNIVFLTNYYDSDIEDIVYLDSIAKPFDATINVINIEQQKDTACEDIALEFEKRSKAKIEKTKLKFHCFKGSNIEEIINNYSIETPIDLLVMSTRHRSGIENLYDPSFTETVAYDTTIPLLTFHISNIPPDEGLF